MTVVPELTVVIPTKNRQATALRTVVQAASVGAAAEVEVVVHDCSDDASLGEQLAAAGLRERVTYVHTAERLSMTANWNRAVGLARGEFVMIIGDDDAVGSDVLRVLRAARGEGLQAVKARRTATFWHPDFNDARFAGKLSLPPYSGAAEIVRSEPLLRAASRTGDEYVELPLAYHGITAKPVLERIRERTGAYFHGYSPDIYSAYAVAATVDRFGVVDYPISIVGASGRSNTARINVGLIHLHYDEFVDYPPTWLVPDSIQYQATNADNMVRALEGAGRRDLLERVDVARIFARTIVAEPGRAAAHVRKYVRACRGRRRRAAVELPKLGALVGAKLAIEAARTLRRNGRVHRYDLLDGVADVRRAVDIQDRWMAGHAVRLQPFGELRRP